GRVRLRSQPRTRLPRALQAPLRGDWRPPEPLSSTDATAPRHRARDSARRGDYHARCRLADQRIGEARLPREGDLGRERRGTRRRGDAFATTVEPSRWPISSGDRCWWAARTAVRRDSPLAGRVPSVRQYLRSVLRRSAKVDAAPRISPAC